MHFFCSWLAGGFLFVGCLFVANSSFNNLGHPLYGTLVQLGACHAWHHSAWSCWVPATGRSACSAAQTLGSVVFGRERIGAGISPRQTATAARATSQ